MNGFRGVIGDTIHDSQPWWPPPERPLAGAPNIVCIMLDDVGFADFGCYGSEIATPNIDGVAARGLRFTNFHTTAICSASRACLLTGRNHHSVGMGSVSNWDTGFPGTRGRVALSAGNLAEVLRPAGYASFAVGKWHLTQMREASYGGPFEHWPLRRGFDRFYGFFDGVNNWAPSDLLHDNHRVLPPADPDYHLTDDLVDHAIEFVRDQASVYPEKPFFLYFCPFACHCPYQVPERYVERVRGRYDEGWDVLRARRLARQKALGIVPSHTPLPPHNPDVKPWDELAAGEREFTSRIYESYAAMLEHTDDQIGRLLGFLDLIGKREDTVVLIVSDNGATREGGSLGDVNWYRSSNAMPLGSLTDQAADLAAVGGPTTAPVNATGWSMVGNTPLKRYKGNTHGGGVRDPLIVSWPSRLADHGGIRHQFCHIIDVLPTVLDLAGVRPPDAVNGIAQQPIEGVSMLPVLDDASAPTPKGTQYFEMHGSRGIWRDGWKAVTFHVPGAPFDQDDWELYHLDRDVGECDNLAPSRPDLVRELSEQWWHEARRYQVLPLDDRILERFLVRPPNPITDRTRFVYYPGAYLPTEAMPDLRNVSYRIEATVNRFGDGVLAACGDRLMGYALYVKRGVLKFHYNAAGTRSHLEARSPLPARVSSLAFEFERTATLRGIGRLFADGVELAAGAIGPTIGVTFAPLGLAIGHSRASSVTPDYEGRFPFEGELATVVVTVGDDREEVMIPTYMGD